jgi:glycerophosphoryl diester phosphodiesterase
MLLILWAMGSLKMEAQVASGESIFRRWAALPRPVLNIAHRGGASLAPENTLAAARRAWELGADLWEFDVRITKDGVPILMHDATLRRTTDVYRRSPWRAPWGVKSFSLEELKRLDAGSWFVRGDPFGQIRAGLIPKGEWQAYIGEPVPTLEEALRFTREHGWRANIEVKRMDYLPPRRIARKVVEVIQETQMEDDVIVSSYDHRILREIKRLDEGIAVAPLVVFRPQDPFRYLEELEADAYNPSLLAFNRRDFAELRRRGYAVNIGPYDAPNRLLELAARSRASGIFTNFPQRLELILDGLFGPDEESAVPD